MKSPSKFTKRNLIAGGLAALGLVLVGVWSFSKCDICMAQLSDTIPLSGIVGPTCSIDATALPAASNLTLTGGVTRVMVANVVQSCNDPDGYTLTVTSAHCAAAPTGAKVVGPTPATDYLNYAVEFDNPATGTSADTTDLLLSSCSSQIARDVTGVPIFAETSYVYLNYTGSGALTAGTYTDTLTVTLATK